MCVCVGLCHFIAASLGKSSVAVGLSGCRCYQSTCTSACAWLHTSSSLDLGIMCTFPARKCFLATESSWCDFVCVCVCACACVCVCVCAYLVVHAGCVFMCVAFACLFFFFSVFALFPRQVVLRVNLFTLFLCATMGRSYQFYYFVPLSTFWYLMLCAAMWALQSLPETLAVVKPVALVAASFVLYYETSPGHSPVFSAVFDHSVLAPLTHLNGGLHEWWFRSGLDRYVRGSGVRGA